MSTRFNLKNELKFDLRLKEIWEKRYGEQKVFSPIFSEELLSETVTFLSLNPSLPPQFRENAKKGIYPEIPYGMIDCSLEKEEYKFFKKFYSLGKELKSWTILDLLYERDSTQANLQEKYNKKTISNDDKEFLLGQIKLTFELLENLNPKVVVVSNSWSEKFIHRYINELNINQELPSEENNFIYKLNNIPFITSESKFLGSRYHEHNEERQTNLKNEINRVLSILN